MSQGEVPFPLQSQWRGRVLNVMKFLVRFLFHTTPNCFPFEASCLVRQCVVGIFLLFHSIFMPSLGIILTAVVFPCWAVEQPLDKFLAATHLSASRPAPPPQTSRSLLPCHPHLSLATNLLSSSSFYHNHPTPATLGLF